MDGFKFVLFLCSIVGRDVLSQPVVSSKVGRIVGIVKDINIDGQRMLTTEFLGIPYAEDTSGQNRFMRPIPKAPFIDTFYAVTISPTCIQFYEGKTPPPRMTEDCLSLNVYVPRRFQVPSTNQLPVIIWIHGGGYTKGAANVYKFGLLSAYGDVIIVTINYRLGEF